jgi:hypothetical protein
MRTALHGAAIPDRGFDASENLIRELGEDALGNDIRIKKVEFGAIVIRP